ncbi:bifunctional diaminohydroxyphosphoribosylaminopyrimidine deaminase/5-amino-6-(5-phosphoribosylamino)uracil reductase RibD [Roseivirga sp. E12]|uniref:bifunctional diaminohydroxyphosphoribosylaminopyrimidine deaminase/5-amino-6-(5-phosphoribosylamino)uracil reductase RibD n=1 Tax=Roseivirga sp. E12 TaxID=2819237 RepID=UPI001EEE9F17|nr:bifunctional diaminohydroxyphosphoribosylaminopyrimidine deaminase/5-amino-6-(5-phosphoribosylamino)uracil reductase RibD [Roseivirga sp. E12]
MSDQDSFFMQRALELAELGRGKVSPNPMVGCVIVHEEQVIGEGWHRKYGEGHAEVNAINDVSKQSLLKEATAYVTLEPCAHHGKTPPCADLLVSKGVKRVVVGAVDSNPLVGGKGIARMIDAGIDVSDGLLAEESRALNRRFFTFIEKKRPYVILKWAQTADGFVARENYDSKWISGEASRNMVHQWRAEEDAIMVGTRTAQYDDPQLNVRNWNGDDPVRVVIDKNLTLSSELKLFDGQQRTLVYNAQKSQSAHNLEYINVGEENYLTFILKDLYDRKIQSIIIEGGSALLSSFIEQGLWDEARIFTANMEFEKGIAAPIVEGQMLDSLQIGNDNLSIYLNPEPSIL